MVTTWAMQMQLITLEAHLDLSFLSKTNWKWNKSEIVQSLDAVNIVILNNYSNFKSDTHIYTYMYI